MSKEVCWKEATGEVNCNCTLCREQTTCKDKATYNTEIEARKERGWKESEYRKKFTIYECSSCEGWHLSTFNNK